MLLEIFYFGLWCNDRVLSDTLSALFSYSRLYSAVVVYLEVFLHGCGDVLSFASHAWLPQQVEARPPLDLLSTSSRPARGLNNISPIVHFFHKIPSDCVRFPMFPSRNVCNLLGICSRHHNCKGNDGLIHSIVHNQMSALMTSIIMTYISHSIITSKSLCLVNLI